MASPKLSVVIAADNTRESTLDCLAALRAEAMPGGMQIIVADCSRDGSAEAIARQEAGVQVIRFPQRTPLPARLAAGLRQAQGEIVAVLEAVCVPEAGWAAALVEALKTPQVAVGGTVRFSGSGSGVDWAAYFCDYGQFMPPRAAGFVSELPGNNCAFPRAWLEKHPDYAQPGFWKTFFLWQLQEREGIRLLSVPAMAVRYRRHFPSLRDFLTRRFHHARGFGAMRRRRLSTRQRWLYTLLAPLLPPLLIGRIVYRARAREHRPAPWWRSLPIMVLACFVWAAGEWAGYLCGAGSSGEKMY